MATTRLWTFQRLPVRQILAEQECHVASWDWTLSNWRKAYRWMASCLEERIGARLLGAPVWCWHSCDGRTAAPPTVWTARALMCDYDFEQGVEMLTLQVPEQLTLLSSYWMWNTFLDHVIIHQALPRRYRWRRKMFRSPLIKHGTDDIQAVVPLVRADWIEAVQRVTVADRKDTEPL